MFFIAWGDLHKTNMELSIQTKNQLWEKHLDFWEDRIYLSFRCPWL